MKGWLTDERQGRERSVVAVADAIGQSLRNHSAASPFFELSRHDKSYPDGEARENGDFSIVNVIGATTNHNPTREL